MLKFFQTRNSHFWEDEVASLFGTGCLLSTNSIPWVARQCKCKVWRKKGEGLMFTGRGSKELAGGRRVHLIVAVSYEKASFYVNRTTK